MKGEREREREREKRNNITSRKGHCTSAVIIHMNSWNSWKEAYFFQNFKLSSCLHCSLENVLISLSDFRLSIHPRSILWFMIPCRKASECVLFNVNLSLCSIKNLLNKSPTWSLCSLALRLMRSGRAVWAVSLFWHVWQGCHNYEYYCEYCLFRSNKKCIFYRIQ